MKMENYPPDPEIGDPYVGPKTDLHPGLNTDSPGRETAPDVQPEMLGPEPWDVDDKFLAMKLVLRGLQASLEVLRAEALNRRTEHVEVPVTLLEAMAQNVNKGLEILQ